MRTMSLLTVTLLVAAGPAAARILEVNPQGTGPYGTIQAAIDAAASGDTISLASGTYTGSGNHNLDFGHKNLMLRSECGDPDSVTIDCTMSPPSDIERGLYFHWSEHDSSSIVDGITITKGITTRHG